MIEKTKSGSRVGVALAGVFATIAGIGEIIIGLTGKCLEPISKFPTTVDPL
jgi:hypothetical protein